jgi:hypothetical protein
MDTSAFFNQIRGLIAADDLNTALTELKRFFDQSKILNEVILQNARFSDISRQIRMGTVSTGDANLTLNQIRYGLLELLSELEKRGAEPALKKEMEQAISISQSKNVVNDSTITAGGDVHIGDKTIHQTADKIYNIDKIDNANFS